MTGPHTPLSFYIYPIFAMLEITTPHGGHTAQQLLTRTANQ